MILSDRELQFALDRKQFGVSPRPLATAFASTAFDLRLDGKLSIWDTDKLKADPAMGVAELCFCPTDPGFNVRKVIRERTRVHDLQLDGVYRMPPRGSSALGFLLGWTLEKLRIPHSSRLCARVEGKSSLARLGLGVHVTAPTIHAGFGMGQDLEGDCLQLEIWNVGPLPIQLAYGMPICQLIFEEVHGTPNQGYQGQFLDQGPTPV